jgi:hypothetical protein
VLAGFETSWPRDENDITHGARCPPYFHRGSEKGAAEHSFARIGGGSECVACLPDSRRLIRKETREALHTCVCVCVCVTFPGSGMGLTG